MSDIDVAIARAYLSLAADLALQAANIASACDGARARDIEEKGDKVADLLQEYKERA